MKKISIVIPLPFTRRYHTRYNVAFWNERGYEVTVYDVGALVLPEADNTYNQPVEEHPGLRIRYIRQAAELERMSRDLADSELIVDLISNPGPSRRNLGVLRAMTRSGVPTLVIMVDAFPGGDLPVGGRDPWPVRAWNLVRRIAAADWINSAIARMPLKWLGVKPTDYVLVGGRRSLRRTSMTTAETKKIHGHQMDYDRYLALKADPPPQRDIAVFIDQSLTAHRELRAYKTRPMDRDAYYRNLNKLFERVERHTGLRMVIAQHPNSLESDLSSLCGGREVVRGGSDVLVWSSRMVIFHTSVMVSLAVLCRKPILMIFSRDFMTGAPSRRTNHVMLAEALERDMMFVEDLDDIPDDKLFADLENGYENYETGYIKTHAHTDRHLWQIVHDQLRSEGVLSGA